MNNILRSVMLTVQAAEALDGDSVALHEINSLKTRVAKLEAFVCS